jgi:hypothetical protein
MYKLLHPLAHGQSLRVLRLCKLNFGAQAVAVLLVLNVLIVPVGQAAAVAVLAQECNKFLAQHL